jgi:hypothetical protein
VILIEFHFCLSLPFVLVWVLRRNIRLDLRHICSFSHDEKLRHVRLRLLLFVNPINEFFYRHRRGEWNEGGREVIAKLLKLLRVLNEKFSGD